MNNPFFFVTTQVSCIGTNIHLHCGCVDELGQTTLICIYVMSLHLEATVAFFPYEPREGGVGGSETLY